MRKSKNGKTVTSEVSAWWNPKDGKFRLRCKDSVGFILTVGDDPKKKRGHPKLFRELTKLLKEAGAPAPD
jgi:hypothetical protein